MTYDTRDPIADGYRLVHVGIAPAMPTTWQRLGLALRTREGAIYAIATAALAAAVLGGGPVVGLCVVLVTAIGAGMALWERGADGDRALAALGGVSLVTATVVVGQWFHALQS